MVHVRWYEKHYACPGCSTQWTDGWSCLCDDRCPTCDLESSPVSWEDKSRALLPGDYEGAEREVRSLRMKPAQGGACAVTAEQARDYAEAKLEGR